MRRTILSGPALILILDNKDSFVWNLAQALRGLGATTEVARSDRLALSDLAAANALVISPGPGRPEDAGISIAAVRQCSGRIPILGVCLGHQAIAAAFGATIRRGAPVHGRTTAVRHDDPVLFADLPNPVEVCRYHALYVDDDLPAPLRAIAWTPTGDIMGLRHADHATFGVQFHPESFRSPDGPRLLANFLTAVRTAGKPDEQPWP